MSWGEPIGYVSDGEIVCETCLGRDPDDPDIGALFEDSESAYPYHCSYCHEFLGGSLTNDGVEWLKEQYLEHRWRDRALIETYMRYYDGVDWHFIHTFWGWMDPLGNLKD